MDERLIDEGDDDSLSSLSKVAASVRDGHDIVIDKGVVVIDDFSL